MDVITEQYDNISVTQLYAKLSSKYEQLNKLEKKDEIESIRKKDYIETNSLNKNYDEQDFSRVLEKFRNKDAEIRTHEQAHAQGAVTTTPISYNYQLGPDGKLYATGGHVRFDTSIPKDEQSASVKLEKLKDASSAPNELSAADAQITRTANLNKLLLHSNDENQGASYENW